MPFDCQSASWHDENVTPKSWLLVARGVATGCAADTGVYLRTSWLVPRIGRQGRIIWMMKNAVQRHWTSFFCAGMWPGDKNCHATRWWARALRGEVSGVENRQVVSPPVRTNVWLGRSPHPIRQGSAAQGSRGGERPAERVSAFPSSRGWSCASAASMARRSAFLSGRGPTRQGQSRRAPIGQRSVEQVCLPPPTR